MSTTEYTAKGGTRFEFQADEARVVSPAGAANYIPADDLLEFARHIEGTEALKFFGVTQPSPQPPPLSRRTEVLAQMAATIAAGEGYGSRPEHAFERARFLLAAVEEAEAK